MRTLETKLTVQEIQPVGSENTSQPVSPECLGWLVREVERAWRLAQAQGKQQREVHRRVAERVRFSLD